ncbi:MAG: PAS domain-containing protein, partial [Thermomicrobiales bacterium]
MSSLWNALLPRGGWRAIVAAFVWVGLACVVSRLLTGVMEAPPIMPYYGAVALSLWFGGVVTALLATLLSVIAFGGLVAGEPGSWALTSEDVPRVITFVLLAVLVTLLSLGRDRVEAELRASERRFRTMLSTANEGVWLIDRAGATQFVNDRMAAMLGESPEVIAQRPALEYAFPEDLPDAQERVAGILSGVSAEFEYRLRRSGGQALWVRVNTSPVRNDQGRVVGILGLFTDMTERRQNEEALNRANERFALATEAVHSLIYDWDLRTGEVTWSSGLAPLLGYRPDEAAPTPAWWLERVHAAYAPLTVFARAANLGDDRFADEYRVRHRGGHWVAVWDQGRVVRDAAGAPVRIIGSVIDI